MTRSLFRSQYPDTFRNLFEAGTGPAGFTGFATTWKTDNAGTSNNDQIKLPLTFPGIYNFLVDWGDGTTDTITVWDQAETTHTYPQAGTFLVQITGTFEGIRFLNGGDKLKILEIHQWGDMRLGDTGSYFHGCANMDISATDILDMTNTTTMLSCFLQCSSITGIPNIGLWDMSAVTSFRFFFTSISMFNEDLSLWDTGLVTNMDSMLSQATAFDQNIGMWNVTSLTTAAAMLGLVPMSTANYDALLIGWESQAVLNGVSFKADLAMYSAGAAATARANLIADHTWTIVDGGQVP